MAEEVSFFDSLSSIAKVLEGGFPASAVNRFRAHLPASFSIYHSDLTCGSVFGGQVTASTGGAY